jgi:cytochrome d ubiquinol oxidase subunit I
MDPLILARLQFASTTVYHFFFVPLTLGLSIIVAIMQTIYYRTGNPDYKRMTKFWGKLFLINFAMGVVTGIVMEFQFGMNWSEYSRYVGDIFGAPLAIEALLAFFLESTFLGMWIFGWERLSKKVHLLAIWLVAIGSNISALWILIANSFMQQPVGFVINPATGRAEMVDFFKLITNPNIFVMFPHTIFAGLTTASFLVMGISAYHLAKGTAKDIFQRSFKISAIIGTIAVFMVVVTGDMQGTHMAASQPMKIAAAESLWKTENPASFSLITVADQKNQRDIINIRIPYALSLIIYKRLTGEVQGMLDLQKQYEQTYGPGNYIPPITLTYWSFRIMVGAGFAMLGLGIYGLIKLRRKEELGVWGTRIFLWAIALPYLANTFGWIMTEGGRYPWVVYGLLKIENAVSPSVGSGALLFTLITFVLVYGVLMAADVGLLVKYAKVVPAEEQDAAD